MDIIEIKEDVVIKQEDGDILLEEGDKVRVFNEGEEVVVQGDPINFIKKMGYELSGKLFVEETFVSMGLVSVNFQGGSVPLKIDLRTGGLSIDLTKLYLTISPRELSKYKIITLFDRKGENFTGITFRDKDYNFVMIRFSKPIPYEDWKNMHSTTRGGILF